MADENNNNNNNADEATDHLLYQRDRSTTGIFFSDFAGNNFFISLLYYPPSFFYPPHTTFVSSSFGLLLCNRPYVIPYHTTYFIGNPFYTHPYFPLPPCLHPPNTHTVLVVEPQGSFVDFHVIRLLPYYREPGGYINYTLNTFSSDGHPYWRTLFHRLRLLDHDCVSRIIIPKSGISCCRWAYWLTTTVTGAGGLYVLRVDVKPLQHPNLTFLRLPEGLDPSDVTKLGRVRNKVGLVVVSAARQRVELYLMNQREPTTYGDDEPMIGWTPLTFLNVYLNPGMMEGAVEVMPGSTGIRCREMPVPLRFESLANMQVLLLVEGRRLVLWANSPANPVSARAVVMPGEIPPLAGLILEDRGIAHVATNWGPWDFHLRSIPQNVHE